MFNKPPARTNEKLPSRHVLASVCRCKADATKNGHGKARVETAPVECGANLQVRGMSKRGAMLVEAFWQVLNYHTIHTFSTKNNVDTMSCCSQDLE